MRSCAAEAGEPPAKYATHAFSLRNETVRGAGHITLAVATDVCLEYNQSTRVIVYRESAGKYIKVLDGVSLPERIDVARDGSIVLPVHDSVMTILEQTYVWNGTSYVASPERSTMYDVTLGERRPYAVDVKFAPGSSSITLRGTTALNFGDTYRFSASKGQRITIELLNGSLSKTAVMLTFGDNNIADLDSPTWSGVLPSTGTYELNLFGSSKSSDTVKAPYSIRLTIH